MTKTFVSTWEWQLRLGEVIDRAIKSCVSRSWREDLITEHVLRHLRRHARKVEVRLHDYISPYDVLTVEWDPYKLTGELEQERGDLAILVVRRFADQTTSEGVAFLEAKRLFTSSKRFDSIRSWKQLEKMQIQSPHHHVVFYDDEMQRVNGWRDEDHAAHFGRRRFIAQRHTRAPVVPTNYVIAARVKTRELYRQGLPFSRLLWNRYLDGFDLEYDKASIARAKGFLNTVDVPRYLVVVTARHGGGEEPLPVEVNAERFQLLGAGPSRKQAET